MVDIIQCELIFVLTYNSQHYECQKSADCHSFCIIDNWELTQHTFLYYYTNKTHLTTAKENGSPCLGRMKEYCGAVGGLAGGSGTGSRLQYESKT